MPQLVKGGKFVFGWSVVRKNCLIRIPPEALKEYRFLEDSKLFLISGSGSTGGLCLSSEVLLEKSVMGTVFEAFPQLKAGNIEGEDDFVRFKGRLYCQSSLTKQGLLMVNPYFLQKLGIQAGARLLSIRGSRFALVLGLKGPIIEAAESYEGEIELF